MIVSLNEIESMVLKASRGAGMSWGLAEEAAQAARWLARRCVLWEDSLVRLLAHRDGIAAPVLEGHEIAPVQSASVLCPIHAGTALADLLPVHRRLTLRDVREPLWLVPFAANCARNHTRVVLTCADKTVRVGSSGFRNLDVLTTDLPVIAIEIAEDESDAPLLPPRRPGDGVHVDMACWVQLDRLAARTYVPASARSRLGGAGAGLLDND